MKLTAIIYPVCNFSHQCSFVGMTAFRFIMTAFRFIVCVISFALRILLNKIECV
jgi:hypothetical protein